jgi:hypothetical protein
MPQPPIAVKPQDGQRQGDKDQREGFLETSEVINSEKAAPSALPPPGERRQQLYRLVYQDLARQARERPDFAQASAAAIDVAVAYHVLAQPRLVPSDGREEVERILSQSDTARQWRDSLPDADYYRKFSNYVREIGEIARDIEESGRRASAAEQSQDGLDWER